MIYGSDEFGPPTQVERERRDIEHVRRALILFRDGFRARLAEPHPKKRNASGKTLQQDEPKWRFCEMDGKGNVDPTFAEGRCPRRERTALDPGFRTWPAHERERWVAGYLHADNLCAVFGLSHARTRDPARTPRKKRESVATPIEAFPECIMSKADAAEWHERRERTRNGLSPKQSPVLAGDLDFK